MIGGAAPLGALAKIEWPTLPDGSVSSWVNNGIIAVRSVAAWLVDKLDGFSLRASAESYSGKCGTTVTWSLDTETGVLSILGTGKMDTATPWTPYSAFVKSIIISNGVTHIPSFAFSSCKTNLASVTIGSGVTNIGEAAFYGCENLKSVYYNGTVAQWCEINFRDDSSNPVTYAQKLYIDGQLLTEADIPDGVTRISSFAFYNCTSLAKVIIPDSVISIGGSVFRNCTSMTSVSIGDGVTSLGAFVFYGCKNLSTAKIGNSVTKIWDFSFYNCKNLVTVEIGHSVTSIESYAFSYCESLVAVTIPDSVTSINDGAFQGCNSMKTVVIGNRVTNIGMYAFYNCTSLSRVFYNGTIAQWCRITFKDDYSNPVQYAQKLYMDGQLLTEVNIPEGVNSIGNYAFYYCTSITNISIPAGVTSIGYYAFSNCTNLTSIAVPAGVTNIDGNAFSNCRNLTDVTLPENITKIKGRVFLGCISLTDVTIPESVTSIDNDAFNGCTKLTSVTIPASVTNIGKDAFLHCTSLSNVQYNGTIAQWCQINFSYNSSNPVVFAQKLYIDDMLITDAKINNGITRINSYSFYNYKSLRSITIPEGVTSIGSQAFYDCSNLTDVIIPKSLTTIGDLVFFGCKIKDVYYAGSEEQWKTIFGNYRFSTKPEIHYNYSIPDVTRDDYPATDGTTISFSKDSFECLVGEEIPLSGKLYSPNGTIGISIEWSTTDEDGVFINAPGSVVNTNANHIIFSALATGKKEGQYKVTVRTSNGASSTRSFIIKSKDSPDDPEDIHAVRFDPESTSGIYQFSGTLEYFETAVILNGSAYVERVTINGKDYNVKKDVLTHERAQDLQGKDVICNFDKSTEEIIAISKCREFSNLNQADITTINNEKRISVKIENKYNWRRGKVYVAGGTREVGSIPFKIMFYNSIPSEYFDLSNNCKSNAAFDYEISSAKVSGKENCGEVRFYSGSFPKTVKLGQNLCLEGDIILPSDFWLGYEDSEKTIMAEYEIKLKSGERIKSSFQTVVINRDQKTTPPNENNLLTSAANKLKSLTAISLIGLKSDLGFTNEQINYLEKLVLAEISMYTVPRDSLEDYISKKVIKKIFNTKDYVGSTNGKITIVMPAKHQGRDIQLDIVCDINGFKLMNSNFGNLVTVTYHAYDLRNGKREEKAFKNGVAGPATTVGLEAFAKAATDLALNEIKSASKEVLKGYEEVERLIFGETVLKILGAAGYKSVFDLGWDLYVNQCKKLAYSCPVDIYIYNQNNSLCGAVVNNEVIMNTSDDVDLEVINDEKIVTLWDDNYYVKTLSNCTGTLNISVKEKGYVNGNIRVMNFEDIPLEIGTIYTQHCGNGYYDDSESYAVEFLNGNTIEASTDTLDIQPLLKVTVNYNPSGGIVTETSKTVYEGEYVTLPTATKAGYSLLGWSTIGDETAIFDAGSSYKVTADTSLVAVWENNPILRPSVQSVSIADVTFRYRTDAAVQPQITADNGAKYTVQYASSNPNIAVDENGNIHAAKRGTANVTVTVTDEFGGTVSDTCTVTVKYAWWQWLILIFLLGFIWY